MTSPAVQHYLDRESPVTAALRPLAAGEADWPATKALLEQVKWANVDRGTTEQLMGKDGGGYVASLEPGDDPVAGSWAELLAAQDLGILTSEQVGELLAGFAGAKA